jgi:hypothetical protein
MPWYIRVSYPLNPFPVEWANQIFSPEAPYIAASLVPGIVRSSSILEFERKDMYPNATAFPDILVYNSDYSIKYALDGSAPGTPKKKGNVFPWQRGQINSIDPHTARVLVNVEIDPTDIVFAYYQYREMNIIYRDIDLNPFTNPIVKDNYVQFYVKTTGTDGLNNIFYKVIDAATNAVLVTNDTSPGTGSPVVFSTVSVGAAVSIGNINVEDIRVRGGGLSNAYESIAESVSCWDLGFWDGKPYPVTGSLLVYLPISVLDVFDRATVLGLVEEILPAGSYPLIKYYSEDGTESV